MVRTCVEDCFVAETPPNICAARSPSIDTVRFGSWFVLVLNLKIVLLAGGGEGGAESSVSFSGWSPGTSCGQLKRFRRKLMRKIVRFKGA